jgi:hypothetical protein
MLKYLYLFTLAFLFVIVPSTKAEDVDSIVIDTTAVVPLMEEQDQGEKLFFGKDTVSGKALDSATWRSLTKDLNYSDTLQTKKKPQHNYKLPNFSINSTLTKYILFALVIVALLYLLYRLIGSAIFIRDPKVIKAQATFDMLHDDEQLMQKDLNALLQEALQQGDYKSAIRLSFLQSLQDLQEIPLIHWKKEKTNRDYLHELSNHQQFIPFSSMVLLYEKAWYSESPATIEDMEVFNTFKTQLKPVV